MAWYSLYKWFVSFRKLPYVNIINWYRQFLYEGWFNSLTEEEQKKEKARIKGKTSSLMKLLISYL